MAPTSDERHEVAEALRGLRHMTYYSEEVVENIKDAIGIADPVNTFREPEDVYELLAGLIDPTCEVDSIEPVGYGEFNQAIGSAFHLTCGHTVMRALTDMPPAYCDECGARVVVDDG